MLAPPQIKPTPVGFVLQSSVSVSGASSLTFPVRPGSQWNCDQSADATVVASASTSRTIVAIFVVVFGFMVGSI